MIGSFTEVKPLYYWVQHILPLVYDDSLSYMELLGKVTKILNELVENNNLLPDYIMQLIKEYISSGEIEKVLSEVLANYMLNVKFPPKGLTPAVGDGSADDTEAIQGCIDYAYQNGGMAVYFPSGAYLTQPLTLNEKVTLFGQDRYTTRIVMKGGATKPLFTGTIDEMSLTGLGFDGNMDIQVNNVNLFTITVNSAIITNCLLTDGYDLLNITVNNELQLDNILFRHAVENALVVGGAGYVQETILSLNLCQH
ncbi:MAG: glycosyl hydrolase family 28-related protein [Segatella copri]